ncbi:hypothetical protein FQA39_LY18451 [Lamprigera yunnana]|nr:hypothetical protein FQA39_LY18451 [Lamprigera yunnana]
MNVDRQEEEVTVQGVGSPVPARGELGAGSPGSIIGHCTVVEVGDQAFPPRLNTGTETSTPGTSGGNTPYEWDEAYPPPLRDSRDAKGVREGKEREEKMNRELEQYRLDEDGVRDELMRELEQYRRERDEAREESESALRQLAEIRADAERLKYILSTDRTEEVKMERINEGMMEGEKSFQNFAKLNEEKEWPSKLFKCVKLAGGNRERWKRERNVICVIGEGVVGSESEVRVIGLIRAKETQQNENGKTMYGCVEDMINKLGALGIKEAGVKGYGVEVPDIVARTLEYHSRGKNFSSVLYGEGGIEDKGGTDRVIKRDTMFVKLREGQSYADTMKKLRKEVDVRDTGVRVMEVKNVRDKEIAIRCLETEEIKMASERTGIILRVLDVDETVGKDEIESAIEQIAGKEARERKLFKVIEWDGGGGEIKRKWKGISVETTKEIGRKLVEKGRLRIGGKVPGDGGD